MYLYFTMKFSEDIINIFTRFKETTRSYNLRLFHNYRDISLDLEQFLFSHLLVQDPYNDDDDDNNYDEIEENNIDINIDEY